MSTYTFTKKDRKEREGYMYDLYTFKSMYNFKYFVEVEHRDANVKIVKFFLRDHRHSENKYSLTLIPEQKKNITDPKTGKKKEYCGTGAGHFLRVLNTMLAISLEYYREDPTVSFGFMGAPTLEEKDEEKNKKNINPDGTIKNTTRFRIYRTQALNYFPEDKFEHIQFTNSSSYVIRNKVNKDLDKNLVKKYHDDYIRNM